MKAYLLSVFMMTLILCSSQKEEILFINRFIEELKHFDDSKYNELTKYLEIDSTRVKKEEIIFWTNLIKSNYSTQKYVVIDYKQFKSNISFKEYRLDYHNPKFPNNENVYCVLFDDESFNFIILNDSKSKIISYFSGLQKNKYRIVPLILK